MKSERHAVLALAVSCAVLQEGGTRSEASGPTEGVRSTKDQGLSFRERGDEAGTRDNVQGESGPRRTHAAPNGGKQPQPTTTPKLNPPLSWGRGRMGAGPRPVDLSRAK